MYLVHSTRTVNSSEESSAATASPSATPAASSGPSSYGSTTMVVAIVVAVLLFMALTAIAVSEHRKKKAADAQRAEASSKQGHKDGLARWETQDSVGSSDSAADLKEPAPAARGLLRGRLFLLYSRVK
ncbi:hypothetical protein EsH8_III_001510 [Colletotrichum jinshuiense]